MAMQKVVRLLGCLGVVSVAVYVLVSGIMQGRGVETAVYFVILTPVALLLSCMLSEACVVPCAVWRMLFRRKAVAAELEEQSQEV